MHRSQDEVWQGHQCEPEDDEQSASRTRPHFVSLFFSLSFPHLFIFSLCFFLFAHCLFFSFFTSRPSIRGVSFFLLTADDDQSATYTFGGNINSDITAYNYGFANYYEFSLFYEFLELGQIVGWEIMSEQQQFGHLSLWGH